MSIDRDRPKSGPSPPKPSSFSADTDTTLPGEGGSRIDTMPEHFARLLGKKSGAPGDVIGGRFRLLEKLGGGAMGDVFVAENTAIGLRVAVKLLKPELLADGHFRRRFQREAQAIASVEHPNVARFFDLVVGDPTFLVMEYVRGTTLSERLRRNGPLPVEQAINLAVRLCWGLRAAHAVGVIHRDLKPANVMLAEDAEQGEIPKLIDFGLAKLATRPGDASLTRSGQLVGTPQYMSPEQIAGKDVDARSDIYALGCLAFEMLTGRAPFTGNDDFQVLYKQVHEAAPKLREVAPELPVALETVLARALSKEPSKRQQSVTELAEALAAATPSALPPSGVRAIVPPTAPGDPLRTFAIAAAVVIAVGFTGGFIASKLTRRNQAALPKSALFVLSEPSGALVELDGRALPQTTPTVANDVAPGQHTVRIQRVGSAAVTQTVNMHSGERVAVQVILPATTHHLEVRTVPDGASVYLDGRLILGETPTSFDVSDDDFHELRVEKTGYETVVRPLTPDDKEPTLNLSLAPEKSPRGTLMVDANAAAEVWIDGVNSGYTTPTLGIELAAGTHTVEVRDGNGHASAPAKVIISKGQTLRLLLGWNSAQVMQSAESSRSPTEKARTAGAGGPGLRP